MTWPNASSSAVVRELQPVPDPVDCLRRLAHLPHCLFLDSALKHPSLGRYTYLTADPFQVLCQATPHARPFAALAEALSAHRTETLPNLPPFQGGAAGYLSYDLHRALENIPAPRFDEFQLPVLSLGLYDVVIAWDHQTNQAWLISQGLPERDPERRRQRAIERSRQFIDWIMAPAPNAASVRREVAADSQSSAPRYPIADCPELFSDFSRQQYLQAIQKTVDYIYAGDLFQANLSQRLLFPARVDSLALYERLRQVNPAPFAGFYRGEQCDIVSASPEMFFRIRGRDIESRPIKGTRRRTGFPESDLIAGYELMTCEKDRSENVMIVDLLRNDLSRCCTDDSIVVTQLCQLERYASVMHLVSSIRGQLRDECDMADVLESIFPGGSITGAPKVRAMEVIAELEPTARGPYCGALGYLGFDGSADMNILIRTITAAGNWWQIPVGGGIVAMSDPEREYEETWTKASGLLRAVQDVSRTAVPPTPERLLAPR